MKLISYDKNISLATSQFNYICMAMKLINFG